MESLDKYFFNLSQNCDNDGIGIEIDKGKIIQNYKKYGYEDDNEMELDINILLKMKYKNIYEKGKKEEHKARPKQEQFRLDLIKKYNGQCIVSDSECLTEVDAAHIKPVHDYGEYSVENGFLLKKDIHSTFDEFLWSINPETLILESTNKNIGEIKRYVGKKINIELTPQLKNNLIYHYRKFKVL